MINAPLPSTVVSACKSSSKEVSCLDIEDTFAILTNGRVKRIVRTGAICRDSRDKSNEIPSHLLRLALHVRAEFPALEREDLVD